MASEAYVLPFDHLRMSDVGQVGGKNASLGEMISQLDHLGVRGRAPVCGVGRDDVHVVAALHEAGGEPLGESCGTVDVGGERVAADEDLQGASGGHGKSAAYL